MRNSFLFVSLGWLMHASHSLRDGILSRLRGTLSLIDRRPSDISIGACTPLEEEYGRERWFWRPQTHTYLERKRCRVGIIP